MKYIFVNPVIMNSDSIPIPGIPLLISILENTGVETEYINLNADYVRYLTTDKIKNNYKQFEKFYNENEYKNYPEVFKDRISKYKSYYETQKPIVEKEIFKFDICKKLAKKQKISIQPCICN